MGERLGGKVAIITGATSGIGRAAALLFAREGARVALAGRRTVEGEAVVAEVEAAGGEALFVRTDVSVPEDVRQLLARTEASFGRVDILYSSAGVMATGTAEETAVEDWEQVIAVNLASPFYLCKYGVPALARAGGGSVILTASELGLVGASATVAYCAAKGGVVNMTRALAIDCSPLAIRVNCLCPGPVDTPMLREWFRQGPNPQELERRQTEPVLLGRFGRSEEIAEAALFLASDASSFMTGSILVADGGATAWYGL